MLKLIVVIVSIVSCVALVLYLFGFKVSFNPFKVSFDDWMYGLGVVLLWVGVSLIGLAKYSQGQNDCLDKTLERIEEIKKESIK